MADQNTSPNSPDLNQAPVQNARGRTVSRRDLIRAGLAMGGVVVAAAYVKPSFETIGVPRAFAAGTVASEGCTPGYWKNHTGTSWPAAYQDNPEFSAVFIVPSAYAATLGSPVTLEDALNQGGGCEKALGRHGAAALLNAEMLGAAAFGLSTSQVIGTVNSALDSQNCATIEDAKDSLMSLNEATCTLGGKIADP